MLNLDTHILIDLLRGEVSKRERTLLEAEDWCVSDIVLWEIAKLNQIGRIEMDFNDKEIIAFFRRLKKIPITLEIACASTRLDFRSDPADELIAATSLVCDLPLLTRDKAIRKSRLIRFA